MSFKTSLLILFSLTSTSLLAGNWLFPDSSRMKPDSLQFWKISGTTSLTFNQIAFSNWAKGGENSFSGKAAAD